VDFFNLEHWPVFNVADSSIVVGVVLLALVMLREEYRAARESPEDGVHDSSEEQALSQ
jgi:lipoprotein signal peptidase